MPGVPSNKACERCKKRHIKCDETRPHCQRCTAAGIECPGYVQTRKFIDQGASVRRRYAPYQDHASKLAETGMPVRNPRANATSERAPGSPGSREPSRSAVQVSFTDVPNQPLPRPGVPGSDANHLHRENSMPNEAVYHSTSQIISDRVPPSKTWPSTPNSGTHQLANPPAAGPNQPPSQTFAGQASPQTRPSSKSPSQRSERGEFEEIFSELMTGTAHEISFLTRHYSEVLAPWLDVSDTGRFFEAYVPVRAIDEQSLKYAIAALAAKHLARMKGVKPVGTNGMFTSPTMMESYPNAQEADWSLKGANYYYLAVSHMNSVISDYACISTSEVLESPIAVVNRWLGVQLREAGGPHTYSADHGVWRTAENLLATSTILTLYKLLDEPGESWQSYLTGIKPLFSQLLGMLHSGDIFSSGVAAVFWNVARLDYLASYYNRLPTHLDPGDLPLWRAAGLMLDDQGNLLSSSNAGADRSRFSIEASATNVLTRLLNKLTNFLAASKRTQLEHWVGRPAAEPSSPGGSNDSSPGSHPTTATWLKLSFEFQSWVERIPETFRPCLRLERSKPFIAAPDYPPMPFPEIFYSFSSCAAAMQQYHFGRLALILNRPSDGVAGPTTAFDRLQSYRELTKEVDYRCREICGIALGRPQGGARVQMITLLYAVGQCLEKPEEREIVVELLRGIEADLGWSTASQVQRLQK
ncbi:hypothetical protein BJX61DRAFT_240519 [Aspergillus egyptiacus]|nr:hypothetical protein BJX61DRAFT_240519 [Aspergillus egyptiacus]